MKIILSRDSTKYLLFALIIICAWRKSGSLGFAEELTLATHLLNGQKFAMLNLQAFSRI
ncbi:MAG: hypothetical protein RBS07_16650 [Lentimicrobium sp.]|jgi:hypothetical protein|nr:hypothetical protein [Lentimicrobium sp.]